MKLNVENVLYCGLLVLYPLCCMFSYTLEGHSIAELMLNCFFFLPSYFSFQQFFFLTYFAHYLAIFLLIKVFLVYLQLLSMHDCCIRVIHNMVTVLLEHLDILAGFPEAYVDVILFVTILVEYLHLHNAK